jgi:hypothetical protein
MQKVEGSNPFSRFFANCPARGRLGCSVSLPLVPASMSCWPTDPYLEREDVLAALEYPAAAAAQERELGIVAPAARRKPSPSSTALAQRGGAR